MGFLSFRVAFERLYICSLFTRSSNLRVDIGLHGKTNERAGVDGALIKPLTVMLEQKSHTDVAARFAMRPGEQVVTVAAPSYG
jgi:hypothetical protein